MECLEIQSPKWSDENRVKIAHNSSPNTTWNFSSIFWSQSWSQDFSHTNKLSKTLQTKKLSAYSSKRLVELTIQVLQNMNSEHSFNSFCNTVAKKSTECKFIKDPINPRKRKSPNYFTMHLVDGTASEAKNSHPTRCQDRYRVMYYNVLDTVVTSLPLWFNQSSFAV